MASPRRTSPSKPPAPPAGKPVRSSKSGPGRIVLFPTEASNLGRKTIEHAVQRVTSKK